MVSNLSSEAEVAKITVPQANPDQIFTTAAKGGGILLGGQFFAYSSRFVTGILLARFLAAEQYGLYNLTVTVVEIAAGLASVGLAAALVRYIPIFVSRGDKNRLWGILQIGLGLPAILSVLLGAGLYLLAGPIAEQVFDEPELIPLLQLVSPIILFFALTDMLAAATRGFRNMHYTVIAQNIVLSIVKFVLILSLAVFGLNAVRAMTATALTEMVICGLLLYFLNKQFSLKPPLPKVQREFKEVLSFSLPGYAADLIATFSGNIKILLLGTLYSVATVGVFAVARQITTISDMFHVSIVKVSQPIIAELSSRNDREQLGRFYQTMTRWSFTLNLPLFLSIVLFPTAIISIFGESFIDGIEVLRVLAWAGLVNTATGICGVLIDMSGNTRLKLVNTVTSVVANILLSLLMIPAWGLIGAAVASLASATIMNVLRLIEVFILFRLLPYNTAFLKPLIAGGTALSIVWVASWFFPGVGLMHLIISMSLLFAAYMGTLLLLGLPEEDRLIMNRLRRRVETILSR